MMWLLLLLGLVVLGIVLASIANRGERAEQMEELPARDAAPTSAGPPDFPPSDSAPMEEKGGVPLQPWSPIPLTIDQAAPAEIAALRETLEDERTYGRERQERMLAWLLTSNARVREIDAFISEWGPRYRASVQALCEADSDWATASTLDRQDILGGARQQARQRLDVRVRDLDYDTIAEPPALAATADDALLARYGFPTLSFYLRHASDLSRVHAVPSDDWYRPRFEALVTKGLARRGADVDPEGVLESLTLKDMELLAEGLEHKRFTRRAPAIAFLTALPDLRERLGKHVSLRGLFQLSTLPVEFSHFDLQALGHAWAYAAEYAKLLEST